MQFYRVMLFLVIFNASLAFVNSLDMTTLGDSNLQPAYIIQPDNRYNMTANVQEMEVGFKNTGSLDTLWYVVRGLTNFIVNFAYVSLLLPVFLAEMQLPTELIAVFTVAQYTVYGAALLNMWSGRDPER